MRIGILKQLMKQTLNSEGKIIIDSEMLYGGQAYKIHNYYKIRDLIDSLYSFNLIGEWVYSGDLEYILLKYDEKKDTELNKEEYDELREMVDALNDIMPTLELAVDAFSPDQDQHIINVKLPGDLNSLDELSDFNKRLKNVFAKMGVNDKNGLILKGFDTGTEWYQLLIDSGDIFKWVIVIIGIAWSCIRIRKEWFESEISRLTLKALKDGKKINKQDEVVEKVLRVKIKEEIEKVLEKNFPMLGKQKQEVYNQLESAIDATIKEMDNGTEFHLSLNPPEGAREIFDQGLTDIEYFSMLEKPTKIKKELPQATSVDSNKDKNDDNSNVQGTI